MAVSKKTIQVEQFKNYINEQLARRDEFATDEFKSGLCVALEEVLHKSNNYRGYQYLYWNQKGYDEWLAAGQPQKHPEKDKYIYGDLGRYARVYY